MHIGYRQINKIWLNDIIGRILPSDCDKIGGMSRSCGVERRCNIAGEERQLNSNLLRVSARPNQAGGTKLAHNPTAKKFHFCLIVFLSLSTSPSLHNTVTMRGKRAKNYRKLMQQYSLAFGFREPYQILVASSIVLDAARLKIDLEAALNRTVQGEGMLYS